MKTAVIIQARLGSSRLPAKILLPLPTGRTVLEEVLQRCYQIPDVDRIVIATPEKDLDIISEYAVFVADLDGYASTIERADYVGGSEHNVLARYYKAACRVNADTIMRITADCPLIDPAVCFGVLCLHKVSGAHYTSNIWPKRHHPAGYDCEVFSMEALAAAHYTENKTLDEMEHVTPLIRSYALMKGKAVQFKPPPGEVIDQRPRTLDTLEDYRHIWGMMEDEIGDGRTAA